MEKDLLLVSIRCITYNHELYIRQCLEGFVMQKTNFKFEAIVHDDASTDRTADIIREYADKYPEIIKPIYETENQYSKKDGSLTRIMDEHTKGKYVAWCEGDDYWIDPLKLQKQVDFMEKNKDYSMCFTNAFVLQYGGDARKVKAFNDYDADCDLTAEDAIAKWLVPTASVFMKREYCLTYPENLATIYSKDYSRILICFYGGKIRYLNRFTSVYRQVLKGTSSMSATVPGVFVMEQHIKLLESYNIYTEGRYQSIIEEKLGELTDDLFYTKNKKGLGLLLKPMVLFRKMRRKYFIN